jgi:cytidyltransferase-like protein
MPLARPEDLPARLGVVATIARFKPVHLGHSAVLEALIARADRVVVGLGSSNRYNARNPFTAAESAEMIRELALDRVELIEVPDLDDGPRWRAMVVEMLGPIDLFVTANTYVRDLLVGDYRIAHPVSLIAKEKRVRVDGTMVRKAMARGDDWRSLVDARIAAWLDARAIVPRFLREFGAETLAADSR